LVISAASHEARVAILEEGQLVEITSAEKEFALVGSIYKGRVTRCSLVCSRRSLILAGRRRLSVVSDVFENSRITITIMVTDRSGIADSAGRLPC